MIYFTFWILIHPLMVMHRDNKERGKIQYVKQPKQKTETEVLDQRLCAC